MYDSELLRKFFQLLLKAFKTSALFRKPLKMVMTMRVMMRDLSSQLGKSIKTSHSRHRFLFLPCCFFLFQVS